MFQSKKAPVRREFFAFPKASALRGAFSACLTGQGVVYLLYKGETAVRTNDDEKEKTVAKNEDVFEDGDDLDFEDLLDEDDVGDVDETFGVDEEYDEWSMAFADEEADALDYAAQEAREWHKEFVENARRLHSERHFYSDTDEYVEEQDPLSGATVRLTPGMHLCEDDDDKK